MNGIIFESQYWKVELADEQLYLGRAYVACKTKRESLSELTDLEFSDLHEVIKKYETLLKKTFGATLFNWSCLMNHAYREKPYTPQVHFHVRPRYENDVIVNGEVFHDPNFGDQAHLTATMSKKVSPEMFTEILAKLKSNL
ncbi:MAG: HIT family protein [Candidatus Pacebacteria bacterium]|jgi:diadenosine tetraphosphate (Ap4A) HIT family hydrolase|nr:HIT family protein [Candidatus Paceibacterota bacterium]